MSIDSKINDSISEEEKVPMNPKYSFSFSSNESDNQMGTYLKDNIKTFRF